MSSVPERLPPSDRQQSPEGWRNDFFAYLSLVPIYDEKIINGIPVTNHRPYRNFIQTEFALQGVQETVAHMNIQPAGKEYIYNKITGLFFFGIPPSVSESERLVEIHFGLTPDEVLRLFSGDNPLEVELAMYRIIVQYKLAEYELRSNTTVTVDEKDFPDDISTLADAITLDQRTTDPEMDERTRFTLEEIKQQAERIRRGDELLRRWRTELMSLGVDL